nr:ABC transporter ATP-binding protein [Actinomyces oris]
MSPTASDTSASTGLSVRGLAVTYGDLRAVDGVDLEVAAGEVVALLGASGSGKSSLLRAVAGLEDVAAGEVAWDGRSMVRVPVHKRGFGLMFQDGQLFEHRDVGSNIAYGLTGLPRAQRGERVREMLKLVGLPGFERRRVTTLSGGQAQRVALARALAPAPRLLLLDEPLSALDRALREQLATDVRTILRQGGTTALYVTHDQDEAMTVADRVGVMEGGRLLRLDTPQRLWADPASSKVARFLGFDVVGDFALAPGALRVVEAAAGEPGERGGSAQTETLAAPETPGTLSATLPATVLASRLRRGQWEVEVELNPERLAGLAGPDGLAELVGPDGPAGVGADAAAEREPARATCATALTRRPHAPGTRVALSLDPARTARL